MPAYRAFRQDGSFEWVVAETREAAQQEASAAGFVRVEQDEDVLDTWFSSGLWPFATLGWPDRTEDFRKYFPNSILETGSDILFFWVARMVMLSYELCGSRPFDTILLHGIVRDSHGRKMSKSLGNVIDPIHVIEGISLDEMIENLGRGNLDPREVSRAADALRKDFPAGIPKCGADALRFALLSYMNGARDINLDVLRVQGYSRLCNKLYNAYRYVSQAGGGLAIRQKKDHHRWILRRLGRCIAEMHRFFGEYNFMMATQTIHSFFLYEFCDIFIEATKGSVGEGAAENADMLMVIFKAILELFNPFMPFITEELHNALFGMHITGYPDVPNDILEDEFDSVVELSKTCRGKKIQVVGQEEPEGLRNLLRGEVEMVQVLEEYQVCGSIRYSISE